LLFLLGLAAGSFLNVVALRYDPDRFIFARRVVGGRSRCERCKKTLRFYELIPILSFALQLGRCRSCRAPLSLQYMLAELAGGLIAIFVPAVALRHFLFLPQLQLWLAAAVLLLIFWALLLLALIDIRLRIIPDELNIFLIIAAIALWFILPSFPLGAGSFVGAYSLLFGLTSPIWLNHLAAAVFGAIFVGTLILVTRGRGMGLGDLKLAFALGMVFGWPDIAMIIFLSFVLGALAGIYMIVLGRKHLKSTLPFGPYLVIAAALVYGWGFALLDGYFRLFVLV